MSQFVVFPYEHQLLQQQIAEHAQTGLSVVQRKMQDDYLRGYLTAMAAKCFIVETRYVDRDYLEEHAAYYVRCFRPYERFCSRIHFFGEAFSQEQIDCIVAGASGQGLTDLLLNAYLGFVVIKPLPQMFFGRTCLKTYPPDGDGSRRYYPALVGYKAHVAGIELSVESLAFQEQDHGVAACATSALWSAFQATGRLFQHPILSPAAITQAAVSSGRLGRVFPSEGLNTEEICQACRAVGLDAELFSFPAQPEADFKTVVQAYLSGGLPVVLLVELLNLPQGPALHAVTLSGFSTGASLEGCWRGSRVSKVYAHDDQIGPFARMAVTSAEVQASGDTQPTEHTVLTTSWLDGNGERSGVANVVAVPLYAVVPVYHKIRLSARHLIRDVDRLHCLLTALAQAIELPRPRASNWGIELRMLSELKREWRQDASLPAAEKARLLPAFLPRFTWVITARDDDDVPLFDILIDATDTCDGACIADVVVRDAASFDLTTQMALALASTPDAPVSRFIERLSEYAAER
ncbi:hypothetical protein LLH23_09545 [bacterium]|nr:hypothetical protein [bacterium]